MSFITDRSATINGITLPQIGNVLRSLLRQPPQLPLAYYGGEFIGLRGDNVRRINEAYPELWAFNLAQADRQAPKLNEEAHVLSVLAERLGLCNAIANVCKADVDFAAIQQCTSRRRASCRMAFALRKEARAVPPLPPS